MRPLSKRRFHKFLIFVTRNLFLCDVKSCFVSQREIRALYYTNTNNSNTNAYYGILKIKTPMKYCVKIVEDGIKKFGI